MTVRLIDMPTTVHSFVIRKDGIDTIVINSRLSVEQQRECYMHEERHIKEGHMDIRSNADLIEIFAHKNTLSR